MTDNPLIRFDLPEPTQQPVTDFETATREFQKNLLQKAILTADGNKETAAKNLGLSRSTFYRYLSQLTVQ
jgi:transcriptional regulator of acetoin/glycerol metabolism